MTRISKFLLIFELVICFGPVISYLILGTFYMPFLILNLLHGNLESFWILCLIAGGISGCIALFSMVIRILNPHHILLAPKVLLGFSIVGACTLMVVVTLLVTVQRLSGIFLTPVILPIVAVIHISYLGRAYLFEPVKP